MSGIDNFTDEMLKLQDSCFEEWFDEELSKKNLSDVRDEFWHDFDEADFDQEIEEKIQEQQPEYIEVFKENYLKEEIKKRAMDYYNDRINSFINNLYDHFEFVDSKHVKVYRSIIIRESHFDAFMEGLANNKFLGKHTGIGLCWAYHPDKAESHQGRYEESERNIELTLTAVAPIEVINYKNTFLLNMDTSCGDEDEIRLMENDYIHLIAIENSSTKQVIEVDLMVTTGSW